MKSIFALMILCASALSLANQGELRCERYSDRNFSLVITKNNSNSTDKFWQVALTSLNEDQEIEVKNFMAQSRDEFSHFAFVGDQRLQLRINYWPDTSLMSYKLYRVSDFSSSLYNSGKIATDVTCEYTGF